MGAMPSVEVFDRHCITETCIDNACERAPAWLQPVVPEIRKRAQAEFEAISLQRDALYEKIGAGEAGGAPGRDHRSPIAADQVIETTDSSDPIVVAAKLDMAIASCREQDDLSDLPQGYICDAMRGLLPALPDEMRAKMEPIAAADDIVKAVYWPRPADEPKARTVS